MVTTTNKAKRPKVPRTKKVTSLLGTGTTTQAPRKKSPKHYTAKEIMALPRAEQERILAAAAADAAQFYAAGSNLLEFTTALAEDPFIDY